VTVSGLTLNGKTVLGFGSAITLGTNEIVIVTGAGVDHYDGADPTVPKNDSGAGTPVMKFY
jgi:hypothetical protein